MTDCIQRHYPLAATRQVPMCGLSSWRLDQTTKEQDGCGISMLDEEEERVISSKYVLMKRLHCTSHCHDHRSCSSCLCTCNKYTVT